MTHPAARTVILMLSPILLASGLDSPLSTAPACNRDNGGLVLPEGFGSLYISADQNGKIWKVSKASER